ncbi:MAG: hypothetical protein ACKVT1_16165 [Dehalococcoidia bacterium]
MATSTARMTPPWETSFRGLKAKMWDADLAATEHGFDRLTPADLRMVAAFLEALARAVPDVDALADLALGPDGTFGIVLDLPRGTVTVEKAPGRPYFEAVAWDAPTGAIVAWPTLDLHAAIDRIVARA